MAYPALRSIEGTATVDEVNAGIVIVPGCLGRKLTVVDAYLRAIGGSVGTATGVNLCDGFMHLAGDATTITATTPAASEGESYALSIELIADHNTHTASTAYHHAATAAVSSTAATTEATLVAQVNKIRTAQLAHYSTEATDAATAIVLENLLVVYHAAHITVTSAAGTVFLAFARAGLTQNAVLRAGAANTTFTNLRATGATGRGLMLVRNGVLDTATSIDYVVNYVVT
jgi:hypothetical protein